MDKITGYLISNSLFSRLDLYNKVDDNKSNKKKDNFDSCVEQAMILLSDDILCGNVSGKHEDISPQKIYKYERKIEAVCNDRLRKY